MAADTNHSDSLLADLTEPQREAVTHVEGPLLVLAGAGSGKTRVITRRIAHLVLHVGVPPWNILAITFTNKAAGEMRDRVAKLVSARQARALTVCTFHSLCSRLLRQYAPGLDLPPGFSIYDSADQVRAVKSALELLEVNEGNFPAARVLGTISNAKNDMVDEEAYARAANGFYEKNIAKVYKRYQEILRQNKALDFDDLLLRTALLLKNHGDVLAELRERFQYILIDEYQDTNHVQFVIANALASGEGRQNICATGDPDQSIYGWRGANIRNILDFEAQYPSTKVVRLEQNYRSTKCILAVADALIRNNRQRKHKDLWTENEDGDPVMVTRCAEERHEAKLVVEQFRRLHDDDALPWSAMAVFYRINSLSRVIEDAFRTAGVPYQIARGTAFFERAEIKDAVGYLRVISNPADEINLSRIINTPTRGISDNTVKAMQAHAVATQQSLVEVVRRPEQVAALPNRAVASVQRFAKLLDQLRQAAGLTEPSGNDAAAMSLRGLVELVLRESGLEEHYRSDKADTEGERFANLGELVTSAQQFEEELMTLEGGDGIEGEAMPLPQRLVAYLERVSLLSDVDSVRPDQGAVTLMTLHAAKGLEFPAVAMIGMEDGCLPHSRATQSEGTGNSAQMEEERRLCFVGITRAQRRLFFSHARSRTVFGVSQATIPSRFLREMPSERIEKYDRSDDEQAGADGSGAADRDALMDERFSESNLQRQEARELASEYRPGTLWRHPQFGVGRVLSVTSAGAQTRAQIAFQRAGVKTLVLQYARLERVQ